MASLLDVISQLYLRISEKLLQVRMDQPKKQPGPVADAAIAGLLIQRVRECAADRAKQIAPQATAVALHDVDAEEGGPRFGGSAARAGTGPAEGRAPMPPSQLALQFSKEPRVGTLQPHIGERLKQRTLEYVNHALALANQGDVEAADACARLAESALKTAADYLSESEYRKLQAEVLSRIQQQA